MLAHLCRRRLTTPLSPILAAASAAASGKNPIHSNHARALLSQSYSSAVEAAPDRKPCPTTVSYLVSCGVSPAVAAARKIRIRDTARADAVRALLHEYGFSDADVTRTVRIEPLLLTFDPDRTIRPKLDFFLSLGIQPRLLATEPHILARSLDRHIIPCVKFLRTILGSDDNIRIAVSRVPRALMADLDSAMRPAVEAFLSQGLSKEAIAKLFMIHMGMIKTSPKRIREAFHDLKALGFRVTDTGFLYAFRVICSLRRETWTRKVALFQSLGVSEADLLRAFKTQPTILLVGEETMKKKFKFFLDVLKVEIDDVMAQPLTLALSLEKNIMPRCAVLSMLMRAGKIERTQKLIPPLLSNSKVFSQRYVLRYAKEVPDVVKAFEGKIKFLGFGRLGIRS
ncbi:transcription termination factor MTERF8, chloroplastic-like [Miscanthus floridulus]|uniref:transcription termination factor MTERF8, chloroplastic-like n=1 Tax=Miscanthus floridulus TaxID=154761 RepID=UPI00345A7512